ncbi:hypothetical protein NDU88_003279 [Pleurodeles waltl]|uniref:Uncharacterized protein n=1 Tax=Pleurodeles waltl TaxID=8319 RepID=A0AAV7TN20_PLEWA|nr:hypothetical protein NDU88_003279 [Pleurodeles waltl]
MFERQVPAPIREGYTGLASQAGFFCGAKSMRITPTRLGPPSPEETGIQKLRLPSSNLLLQSKDCRRIAMG